MEVPETIINVIKSSLNLLCECKREKDIQNILAAQLNCKPRYTLTSDDFPNVEVDLIGDNFAIEVKYNEKYYSGVSQVLSQKYLYNMKNVILLHIHHYLDSKFVNAFKKLAKDLGFIGILINKREKVIEVVNINEGS